MNRRGLILFMVYLSSALITQTSYSQLKPGYIVMPVTLNDYILNVSKGNLGYIAAQFNVSIAEAEQQAAKIFPDPEISLAYVNNEDKIMRMGQSYDAGLSYPINLGNSRKATIELARTQLDLSKLMLKLFFKNLRADAAKSYFTAVRDRQISKLQNDTYELLKNMADADSIRLKTGESTELDAIQTALEAKLQYHNVLQSRAELNNSLVILVMLQGKILNDTLFDPSGEFPLQQKIFLLSELLNTAMESRSDLLIAAKNREISEKTLHLLKADRAFEFNLEADYSYNSIVKNDIAPAPAHNSVNAGITIPLKISSLNKGSVNAAEFAISQNIINAKEVELQIFTEVIQAFNYYEAAKKKTESFSQQLTDNAEKILRGASMLTRQGKAGWWMY
ncbi:MAG: TolC family protein [Bacteroidetes bacterium]|nr:TolC family protein [Bacteroidota bacterium]